LPSAEDAEGKRAVAVYGTVTVEVTPRIAEKIAVAQSIGQLSLSLRSIADNTAELERAIASGEVKVPANGDSKAETNMMLAVASKPSDTDTTYVTGADVSRFQRRSVPRSGGGTTGFTPAPATPAAGGVAPGYGGGSSESTGPVVRIARGNAVTVVPVGGK
jgi:pilus assembly protein CpaB